jgi:hypothetical protein
MYTPSKIMTEHNQTMPNIYWKQAISMEPLKTMEILYVTNKGKHMNKIENLHIYNLS